MTPEQIAEGRRLLDRATGDPWVPGRYGDGSMRAIVYAAGDRSWERVCTIAEMCEDGGELADAAAIVWLRNHANELLDAAERANAAHEGGQDMAGTIMRLTRERDEAIARMQLAERDANVAEARVTEARRFHSVLHDCAAASAHMHTTLKHEHSCAVDSINGWRARAESAERERDELRRQLAGIEQLYADALERLEPDKP